MTFTLIWITTMNLKDLEHDLNELEEFNFIYKQLLLLTIRIEQLEKQLKGLNLED